MSMKTTRRAIVAGIATAPLGGLPAGAGVPLSDALSQAINSHRAAKRVVDSYKRADDEEIFARLVDAETKTLNELAAPLVRTTQN